MKRPFGAEGQCGIRHFLHPLVADTGEPELDRFGLRARNALDEAQQGLCNGDIGESLLAVLRSQFEPVTICHQLTAPLGKPLFQLVPVFSSSLKIWLLGKDLHDVHDGEKPRFRCLVAEAADVPAESLALGFLEPLKLFDEVELELDRDPRGELQGDVQMGISAAVAPGLGLDAGGPRALDPLLRRECEAVETGLLSKPVEFDGIKTWVVDLLPKAEKFECISVVQPVADQIVTGIRVFVAGDVGEADVILLVDDGEADFTEEDFDFFAHELRVISATP